jgi:hypothetical protein
MSTVADKQGIKPGASVVVDGHSLAEVKELLGELPAGVTLSGRNGGRAHQLIVVANGLDDLAGKLDGVWDEIAPDGRLWVWYRKGANRSAAQGGIAPLHRDTLQALLAEHGMDGVTLISVNDVWSAMRVKAL